MMGETRTSNLMATQWRKKKHINLVYRFEVYIYIKQDVDDEENEIQR